jgi:glycyl-tRNA synthetase beta chain
VLIDSAEESGLAGASDIVDAALAAGSDDVSDAAARTLALARLRAEDPAEFERLAATFKRVGNILQKARGEQMPISAQIDPTALTETAERGLAAEVAEVRARDGGRRLRSTTSAAESYGQELRVLVGLKPHVDRFFDDVLVMAEEPALRAARLGLLASVEEMLVSLADFTRIQLDDRDASR